MTHTQEDRTDRGVTVSIEVWVAGADINQAMERRQAVDEHMDRPSVTHVGGGFGRFTYDLWRAQNGTDPLSSEGDCIADSEYHFAARTLTPEDLAALTDEIVADLRDALGFPVAVNLEIVESQDEFDAQDEVNSAHEIDPDAKMLVLITEREHAHLLAALRRVQYSGGLEGTPEAEIAENVGNWKTMTVAELDDLAEWFNSSGVIAQNVRIRGKEG